MIVSPLWLAPPLLALAVIAFIVVRDRHLSTSHPPPWWRAPLRRWQARRRR